MMSAKSLCIKILHRECGSETGGQQGHCRTTQDGTRGGRNRRHCVLVHLVHLVMIVVIVIVVMIIVIVFVLHDIPMGMIVIVVFLSHINLVGGAEGFKEGH